MERLGKCVIAMLGVAIDFASPVRSAFAQPTSVANRSEGEFLVAPQGGAFEAPIHMGAVCILSFPDKLGTKALASSPDFEIKSWGDDGVAVRPLGEKATTTTLALASATGAIKVNITLTVVPRDKPAYTLIRFKPVSAEEAFDARLKAEVAQRVAPLEAELAKLRQNLESHIRERADGVIADRLLKRSETLVLSAHERNDDHVIVHVTRAALLGDYGYLVFEVENRSKSSFRLEAVRVLAGGREVQATAQLTSPSPIRDPNVIGVVPMGQTATGIVAVRSVDQVLGKNLSLIFAGPAGMGVVRLERGIVLR